MSEAVAYDRETLVSVLVYHWPTRTSGCWCGWAKLGASFPEHVADVYEESVAVRAPHGEGLLRASAVPSDGRAAPLVANTGHLGDLGDRLRELSRACRVHADPGAAKAYEHAGNLVDAYVYGHARRRRYGQEGGDVPAVLMSRAFALDPYGTGALLGALARHVGGDAFEGFVKDAEELAAWHRRRYGQEGK